MTPSSIPRALATAGLLAALALGLAACGGDEPAPVVQPPAPQPAPFQPQPVEVALGQHGGKLTLMTKEGGGFTLNGEDVADGAPVTGEENGLAYKLALADGKWAAEYQAASASVMLGQLGGTLALSQNEDKTWSAGGEALPENLTVPGDNGLHYKLALGEDGAWSAEYQAASASVMLGQLGGTLALSQNEDKTWSAGGEALPENLTVPGDNGLHYKLALGEDGAWSAEYQAASASVMLGQLGGTLALSQNEDKTWSLPGGEAADGALVGDAGGPQYRLAQNEDGAWAGAYVPRSASAALGTLGGTLALDVAEDGSAWLGGEPLAAGREVAGPANGLQYRLAQGEDGSWAGQHVPATQPVALGGSGRSVELAQAEDGTWSAAGSPVADGAAYADSLGLKWTLSLADGKWAAAHQAATASVMLGQHGGTLDLAQAEDGSWTLASGEPVPAKLTVPVAGYDNAYAVTRDPATGEYSAAYVRDDSQSGSQAVAVGLAGSLQLYRAEDGSWSASPEPGGDPVAHGHVHPAASGDAYALSLDDAGNWSAAFQPADVEVRGAPLAASTLEGGAGWTLSDPASGASAELAASGDADIQGSLYRVLQTDDGSLLADRYDLDIEGRTAFKTDHLESDLELSADDGDTPADEENTELLVGGASFDVGALLGAGSDTHPRDSDPTFVEDAVKDLVAIRGVMEALVENLTGADDRTNLTNALTTQWNKADDVIKSVFGKKGLVEQGVADTTPRRAVGALQDVIDALSSADALVEATAKNSLGVFAEIDPRTPAQARKIFDAREFEGEAALRTLGSTRYGAAAVKRRGHADEGAAYEHDGRGELGGFAYATAAPTRYRTDVSASGAAHYRGGTLAVDGEGVLYEGAVEIAVTLTPGNEKVSGLVSGLASIGAGDSWAHRGLPVQSVALPEAALQRRASWSRAKKSGDPRDGGVTLSFDPLRSGQPARAALGSFAGQLVGTGDAAGSEAVGTWSAGNLSKTDSADYIAGGFGAVRQPGDLPVSGATPAGSDDVSKFRASIAPQAPSGMEWKLNAGNLELKAPVDEGGSQLEKLSLKEMFGAGDDKYELTAEAERTVFPEMLPDLHFAGKRQIAAAHEEVSDALRVLQGISASTAGVDLVQVRQKELNKVNAALSDHVFGWWKKTVSEGKTTWELQAHSLAISDSGVWPAGADDADDADRLLALGATNREIADSIDLVARVQAALANEEAFEEAFEAQGVFSDIPTQIYDPKAGKPLASVWDAPRTSVLLSVAHTDYTYLGSWRWRWSPHATYQSEGGIDTRAEAYYEQSWKNDVFAYSTLPQTEFEGVDDSRYPLGATLSYEGETVAQIAGNFLKGTAWAQVEWKADAIDSSRMRLELRGLENDGFGPLKLFGWGVGGYKDYAKNDGGKLLKTTSAGSWDEVHRYKQPLHDPKTGKVDKDIGHPVEKIVFTKIPITHDKKNGLVGFKQEVDYKKSSVKLDAHLLIAKEDGSTEVVLPIYSGSDASTTDGSHSYAVKGQFVGQDLSGGRGPQGLIGRFELKVEHTAVSNGNSKGTIKGAFGLELP